MAALTGLPPHSFVTFGLVVGRPVRNPGKPDTLRPCSQQPVVLRINRDDGGPRGAFCFMGVCQECIVLIDGRQTEACRTLVHDGLVVERLR